MPGVIAVSSDKFRAVALMASMDPAFGLAIVAMAYGIGPVSGCHVNPAVSFGVLVAGRMTTSDFVSYVIAQVLGAIAGAIVLSIILSGKSTGWSGGLGQNGWGTGYLGQYNLLSAFVFEVVATFLFLVCILGVTQKGGPAQVAGLAIGLTLVAIQKRGLPLFHGRLSLPAGACEDPRGKAGLAQYTVDLLRRGTRRRPQRAARGRDGGGGG